MNEQHTIESLRAKINELEEDLAAELNFQCTIEDELCLDNTGSIGSGIIAEIQRLKKENESLGAIRDAAQELLEVASLRGDNEYMHPEDDPLLWTSRRNEAWVELENALREQQ